jgi:hypothetical protein
MPDGRGRKKGEDEAREGTFPFLLFDPIPFLWPPHPEQYAGKPGKPPLPQLETVAKDAVVG